LNQNNPFMEFYYPAKIWLAFGETFSDEGTPVAEWLLKNGYPELAALSHSIRGSDDALKWLMEGGFLHLAALDSAIDEDPKAYLWLQENKHLFLIVLADAIHGKPYALQWFNKHQLIGFIIISQKIKAWRDSQTFDYHKKHF
jgi:hypothetical protein